MKIYAQSSVINGQFSGNCVNNYDSFSKNDKNSLISEGNPLSPRGNEK